MYKACIKKGNCFYAIKSDNEITFITELNEERQELEGYTNPNNIINLLTLNYQNDQNDQNYQNDQNDKQKQPIILIEDAIKGRIQGLYSNMKFYEDAPIPNVPIIGMNSLPSIFDSSTGSKIPKTTFVDYSMTDYFNKLEENLCKDTINYNFVKQNDNNQQQILFSAQLKKKTSVSSETATNATAIKEKYCIEENKTFNDYISIIENRWNELLTEKLKYMETLVTIKRQLETQLETQLQTDTINEEIDNINQLIDNIYKYYENPNISIKDDLNKQINEQINKYIQSSSTPQPPVVDIEIKYLELYPLVYEEIRAIDIDKQFDIEFVTNETKQLPQKYLDSIIESYYVFINKTIQLTYEEKNEIIAKIKFINELYKQHGTSEPNPQIIVCSNNRYSSSDRIKKITQPIIDEQYSYIDDIDNFNTLFPFFSMIDINGKKLQKTTTQKDITAILEVKANNYLGKYNDRICLVNLISRAFIWLYCKNKNVLDIINSLNKRKEVIESSNYNNDNDYKSIDYNILCNTNNNNDDQLQHINDFKYNFELIEENIKYIVNNQIIKKAELSFINPPRNQNVVPKNINVDGIKPNSSSVSDVSQSIVKQLFDYYIKYSNIRNQTTQTNYNFDFNRKEGINYADGNKICSWINQLFDSNNKIKTNANETLKTIYFITNHKTYSDFFQAIVVRELIKEDNLNAHLLTFDQSLAIIALYMGIPCILEKLGINILSQLYYGISIRRKDGCNPFDIIRPMSYSAPLSNDPKKYKTWCKYYSSIKFNFPSELEYTIMSDINTKRNEIYQYPDNTKISFDNSLTAVLEMKSSNFNIILNIIKKWFNKNTNNSKNCFLITDDKCKSINGIISTKRARSERRRLEEVNISTESGISTESENPSPQKKQLVEPKKQSNYLRPTESSMQRTRSQQPQTPLQKPQTPLQQPQTPLQQPQPPLQPQPQQPQPQQPQSPLQQPQPPLQQPQSPLQQPQSPLQPQPQPQQPTRVLRSSIGVSSNKQQSIWKGGSRKHKSKQHQITIKNHQKQIYNKTQKINRSKHQRNTRKLSK